MLYSESSCFRRHFAFHASSQIGCVLSCSRAEGCDLAAFGGGGGGGGVCRMSAASAAVIAAAAATAERSEAAAVEAFVEAGKKGGSLLNTNNQTNGR